MPIKINQFPLESSFSSVAHSRVAFVRFIFIGQPDPPILYCHLESSHRFKCSIAWAQSLLLCNNSESAFQESRYQISDSMNTNLTYFARARIFVLSRHCSTPSIHPSNNNNDRDGCSSRDRSESEFNLNPYGPYGPQMKSPLMPLQLDK